MVSALDFQAEYRGFKSRSDRDNFQIISTPNSYSTCPGLNIKWTGRRYVTDSGTKCAWVIHESKAVQIHKHNNRRCLCVPWVPGSVKNPHNNNQYTSGLGGLMVSELDFQSGYRGFESRSGRDNFQTISTPNSYSTCPGLSI